MTGLLLRLFVKSDDFKAKTVRERCGTLGSMVGIFCNILLCVIKITAGLMSASISIVADGLNNLSDMGSSIITMIGFRMANKPADSDHPFGHGRMEYISAFIVSVLILIVGFELGLSAVKTLIAGDAAPEYSPVSFAVLTVSLLIKFWMFAFNRNVGKKIDSSALIATAKDSLNDAVATGAILTSAVIMYVFPLTLNLDAVMALGVALFILWSGISSAKTTLDEILGGPPSHELIAEIEKDIMSFEGFLGIHDLIVHNYGPGRQFASVHVEVPQDVDIVACHERIDLCEKFVTERTGVNLVIHMDPIDVTSESVTQAKQQMTALIKSIDERLSIHDFRMTPHSGRRTNLIFDVLVPSDSEYTPDALDGLIRSGAKEINSSYECVITYDRSFV